MTAPTWQWRLLRAGTLRLDGGSMFGVVPRVLWSRLVEPDERNRIPLQSNCLLLRSDENSDRLVLIETGFGSKWSDKDRDIFALEQRSVLDALGEVDVDPAMITDVIVTHLHFDHAGGLTHFDDSGRAASSFPDARIHVQQTEWDDAIANKSTMTKTYLRNHLDPVAQQVQLAEGAAEVIPGIEVWPAPGHTWGQQAVRFNDESGVVAYIGDVLPTVNHVGAAFSLAYDMLPYDAMLTKLDILKRAATESWRIVIDHEPGDPVVTVHPSTKRPGAFELQHVGV